PVAGAIGARATLVWAAVIGGTVTFAFLFLPGVRDIERRKALHSSQAEPADVGRPVLGLSSDRVATARSGLKDA
ncbi:MAG TPA: hypothetical protein VNA32_09745, partial [Actinomycetota bacterium]|nr:hypothetical protein [Actinomycetota bacterium]